MIDAVLAANTRQMLSGHWWPEVIRQGLMFNRTPMFDNLAAGQFGRPQPDRYRVDEMAKYEVHVTETRSAV